MDYRSLRFRPLFLATLLLCLAALLTGVAPAAAQEPVVLPEPVPLSDEPFIEYAPAAVLVKVRGGVAIQSGVSAASGEATVAVAGNAPTLAASLLAFGATSAEPLYAQPEVFAAGLAETTYRVMVTVQARNAAGLWSVNGVSNAVVAGTPTIPPVKAPKIYLPTVKR